MSDLTATNCGCGCDGGSVRNNTSCLWIIILLFLCGGCGNDGGYGFGGDNCCLIILLLLFCGGGNGCGTSIGNGFGCGC